MGAALKPLLTDKVLLVSGGTQGVGGAGQALIDQLAAEGSGASPLYVQCDLSDAAQATGSVQTVVEHFGRIDSLVNAAGLTSRGTLLDTDIALFDEHVAVNLRAPFFTMQTAVRDMTSRHAPGTIVNIISMASHGGQPYLSPYSAAKAGLAGLTRNAAFAHRWDRVRINGLNIGWTQTEGEDAIQRKFHGAEDDWQERAGRGVPMGRLGQADEIADFVVFLLSDRSGVVTGSVIDWDQVVIGPYD